MTNPWDDFKDRILTNYPGASVALQASSITVECSGIYATAVTRDDGRVRLSIGTREAEGDVRTCDSLDDAYSLIFDALGAAWRAAQKPKSSPGGPSSPGRGEEEGVAAVGDYYEGAGEDDDGGYE